MFGPVATSLPFALIIKPMPSTGSHFYPRLMRLVNLICQIHSPQSRRPCPGREFCGTSKAQGLSAKSQSRGSRCWATSGLRPPLPASSASARGPRCPRFPFFSCWQWNDVGGGPHVAAGLCKQHSWRLLVVLPPCPPPLGFGRGLGFLHFPTSQEAGWVPDSVWPPGWVSAEPRVSLVKRRGGSHWAVSLERGVFLSEGQGGSE